MWKCKVWWNIQLTLRMWYGPWSRHVLPLARHQPHLLIPFVQTINHEKAKNPEMRFNSHQIILYCLKIRAQIPGLRETDFESIPKRCGDRINMLKQGRNNHPAPGDMDLKSSAKRRTNMTWTIGSLFSFS